MSIPPDTKDWTWALQRPCPECGLDTRTVTRDDIPGILRQNAAIWARILTGEPASLAARPAPERWSTLEYACHVRDVLRKFDERLQLMLTTDAPQFANWDQDATAVDDRYGEQSPREVSAQLQEAAQVLAGGFAAVRPDQWGRPGRRSDGAQFTVETLGRYLVHDPVHHLHDVGEAMP
ncbi:MAG TPA: DinB family protein [Acidimicrobiales bacterium]|nr:DinB family protein [Acidimicrobiales bacterium]